MNAKFVITYTLHPHRKDSLHSHYSSDPVEVEEFLSHLLKSEARIDSITHEAVPLTPAKFDRMIKIAAEDLITRMLCESLGTDNVDIRHRFGFAS